MSKKKKCFQFYIKFGTKNYEKILKRKKLWKKFFYGISQVCFFRTLLTLEFVINTILPFHVKEVFILCFFNKLRETGCSLWILKFLKIQEESIWGRFFSTFYLFSFLEFKIDLSYFRINRTDLRTILNLNSERARIFEFWDKKEKIFIEKNIKIPFFLRKKKTRKKFFRFQIKPDIKWPYKNSGKSKYKIHSFF